MLMSTHQNISKNDFFFGVVHKFEDPTLHKFLIWSFSFKSILLAY